MATLADFPVTGARRSLMAGVRNAALFIACYLALDWASYVHPLGPFNITPWSPAPALAIVWLLLGGLRYAPVVFAAILAGHLFIPDAPHGLPLGIGTSLLLAAGYTGIAAVLKLIFRFDGRLRNALQLWSFVAVTVVGAAIIAALYVGLLWAAGFPVGDSFVVSTFQFWLGDVVGILVTAPLLMVVVDATARQHLIRSWRKPETTLQLITLVGLVMFVFGSDAEPHRYFYLVFLPMIWIALRNGVSGAAVASGVVQVGVVLGAQVTSLESIAVVGLQARISALTLMALALGIMVDERKRAAENLQRSLRLVAAGEMAGAIAHEINQPLTALHTYGDACQVMLRRDKDAVPYSELNATIEKLLQESRRASEVVSRLRDFFRAGAIRLEPVKVSGLLESARTAGEKLNPTGDVTFRVESDDGALTLLVDRVQIELVLRNLIANAFEALAGLPQGEKAVTVSTRMLKEGRIRFRVADTGRGLSAQSREHLFEPFSSDKATGMGVGLSICRAIVKAHQGSLHATGSQHGEFDLVLPTEAADE